MASIRRRGDRWHVQVRRKDHSPICKAFAQRKDAEVWARDTERQLDRGEDIAAPVVPVTVGELLIRYADVVSPTKRGGEVKGIRLKASPGSRWASHGRQISPLCLHMAR